MRLTKAGDGLRIRFNPAESQVIEQILNGLQDVLEPGALDAADPVRRRLYPDGYADRDQAEAFRELTEAGLRQERSERLDRCLAEVLAGRSLRRTEVTLDAEGADRWLRVVNDLRLALGTRLGVTEDDDVGLDPRRAADPDVQARAQYLWLTALQDSLVVTLMG